MDQQNQQPIQEKVETKLPTKTNWKYLTIVVVLGLLVGVGTLWYGNSLRVEPQTPQIVIPRPTPSPTPVSGIDTSTPALSGVEGWQTYRNSEFGFEMRHPDQWTVKAIKDYLGYKIRFSNGVEPRSIESVTVQLTTSQDDLYREKLFKGLDGLKEGELFTTDFLVYEKQGELEVGGIPAIAYNVVERAPGYDGPFQRFAKEVLFEQNSIMYHFLVAGSLDSEQRHKTVVILDQILSTFRFVE